MKKGLSYVIITLMAALLLSACGSNNNGNGAQSSPSAAASPAESALASAPSESAVSPSPSSSAPAEVTIAHPLGTATVTTNPAKVVVFDYGTLDTLDKLGIEVAALPKATLPSYLSKYKDAKYEDAGSLFEPDFEKLNKLKPDVIFIGARTASAYEELNKIAPTIQMSLDYAKYTASFEGNVGIIGTIFAKESEAAQGLQEINAAIAELKCKASGAGKALVVLTTGGKISAFGPGSRFGIIHDGYGFATADDKIEVSPHGQSISNEYIAEKNPDVLFVVDRDTVAGGEGTAPAKDIIENALVKNTNAYKNGKIVYLDANYWYLSGGGLQADIEMVKEAAKAVQ